MTSFFKKVVNEEYFLFGLFIGKEVTEFRFIHLHPLIAALIVIHYFGSAGVLVAGFNKQRLNPAGSDLTTAVTSTQPPSSLSGQQSCSLLCQINILHLQMDYNTSRTRRAELLGS